MAETVDILRLHFTLHKGDEPLTVVTFRVEGEEGGPISGAFDVPIAVSNTQNPNEDIEAARRVFHDLMARLATATSGWGGPG